MKKTLVFIFISVIDSIICYSANDALTNQIINSKYFIENKGQIIDQNYQTNKACLYLLNLHNFKIQLRQTGFSYEVIKEELQNIAQSKPKSSIDKIKLKTENQEAYTYKIHRIDIDFLNATTPAIEAFEKSNDYDNYYTSGTPSNGILNVHHYKKIVYKNIYPKIDIEFISNNENSFKYNFILHPGANIDDIQLKINGALQNVITENGSLKIGTLYGSIEETLPLTYELNGKKNIASVFKKLSHNIFGISASSYNKQKTLVIDPIPNRVWGTYYGGSLDDVGYTCALHQSTGNVYFTGNTRSVNAIATAGAHQTSFGGTGSTGFDAFLVMFNTNGVRQWGTYLGGTGDDDARSTTVVQSNGDVYITGKTSSSNAIASPGAHQTTYGGGVFDAFIAKFNSTGVRQWSSFYGGNQWDQGFNCDTDGAGNVYVTGETGSASGIASAGSHQTTFGGSIYDAFLVKFNAAGNRQWGTYYGGAMDETGYGCCVSATGNIYLTGNTSSSASISTAGSHQTALDGPIDAFLVKFNNSGVRQWATYYGGNGVDATQSCAVDPSENIFIAGLTYSTNAIITAGCHQNTIGGNMDGFLAKFNSSGTRLWGTYFGGTLDDVCSEVFLNPSGANIYISGGTESSNNLTTANTHQGTYGGGLNDAFLAKFNTSGVRQWCTYYGGNDRDYGTGGAAANNGDVYLCGETESPNNISTPGAHQVTFAGGNPGAGIDAFIVKFSECNVSNVQTPTICSNDTYTLPNGSSTNIAGTYTHVINLSPGCDSTITTILTVKPDTNVIQNASICGGGNYTLPDGSIVNTAGTYIDTLQTINGCDSIITTNLSVGSSINITQNPVICSGASFTLPDGTIVNTAGTYIDTLLSSNGCDSIITTTLNVNSNYSNTQNINICNGNSYVLPGGSTVNTSGTYIDTLSSIHGCDSIITTILNYTSALSITQNINLCEGNSYNLPDGTIATISGTYIDTIAASNGCDSIITTNLNINTLPTITVSNDTTIFQGTSASLTASGGATYLWSPENGLNSTNGSSIIASPAYTTTYCVLVTDNNGCTSTKCVTVYIEEIPCPDLITMNAPNAFSPNNDGVNDVYCLQGWDVCLTEFQITIFDRWGEKVFESKDPNFCWNGKFRDSLMDSQVLVYHIKANYKHSEKPMVKKGNISLLR